MLQSISYPTFRQQQLQQSCQYHHFQHLKIQSPKQLNSFDRQVTLGKKSVEELQWCSDHLITWNKRDIIQPPPDLVIEADASLLGWGTICNKSADRWSVVHALKKADKTYIILLTRVFIHKGVVKLPAKKWLQGRR